jgi:hypothetical protein
MLPRQDTGFEHQTHHSNNEDITRGLAVNQFKRIRFISSVEMSSMTVPNQLVVESRPQAPTLSRDDMFVQIRWQI